MNGEHLKDGIIEVYGMAIGRDTTGDDFKKALTDEDGLIEKNIAGKKKWFFSGTRETEIAGQSFWPQLSFDKQYGNRYMFTPLIERKYEDEMDNQAARHKVCEEILRSLLGEPDKKEDLYTGYEFPWGVISVVSNSRARLVAERQRPAGYIVIQFKPQEG